MNLDELRASILEHLGVTVTRRPVLDDEGERLVDTTTVPGYVITRYRPRIEGLIAPALGTWSNWRKLETKKARHKAGPVDSRKMIFLRRSGCSAGSSTTAQCRAD